MNTRNAITKLITITMTALLAASILPVKAQTGDGSVRFVSYASIGIVAGERIRLSVANTEQSGGNLTLSFSFYLAHETNASSSVPVYESVWMKVPSGEFRFADVARKDLKTEGEPETGRAQLILRISMIAPAGSNADDFPTSLQIIQDAAPSGDTVKPDSKYRLILLAARRSKQMAPTGLGSGDRLRFSFFNPNEEGSQPVRVQAYVYDSYGNLLRQTDPVVLRPGEFQAFDINRDELRVPGENGKGLLQVRGGIQVALLDGSVRTVKLPVSLEIINNSTGSTSGGNYFTGTVTVSDDGFGGYGE